MSNNSVRTNQGKRRMAFGVILGVLIVGLIGVISTFVQTTHHKEYIKQAITATEDEFGIKVHLTDFKSNLFSSVAYTTIVFDPTTPVEIQFRHDIKASPLAKTSILSTLNLEHPGTLKVLDIISSPELKELTIHTTLSKDTAKVQFAMDTLSFSEIPELKLSSINSKTTLSTQDEFRQIQNDFQIGALKIDSKKGSGQVYGIHGTGTSVMSETEIKQTQSEMTVDSVILNSSEFSAPVEVSNLSFFQELALKEQTAWNLKYGIGSIQILDNLIEDFKFTTSLSRLSTDRIQNIYAMLQQNSDEIEAYLLSGELFADIVNILGVAPKFELETAEFKLNGARISASGECIIQNPKEFFTYGISPQTVANISISAEAISDAVFITELAKISYTLEGTDQSLKISENELQNRVEEFKLMLQQSPMIDFVDNQYRSKLYSHDGGIFVNKQRIF